MSSLVVTLVMEWRCDDVTPRVLIFGGIHHDSKDSTRKKSADLHATRGKLTPLELLATVLQKLYVGSYKFVIETAQGLVCNTVLNLH